MKALCVTKPLTQAIALSNALRTAPPAALPKHSLDAALGRKLRQFYESDGASVPTAQEIITLAGEINPAPSPETMWDDPDERRSMPVATLGPTRASGRTRDVFDRHLYQDALAVRACASTEHRTRLSKMSKQLFTG